MTEMTLIRGSDLLAPFDPLAAELADLQQQNASLTFDYATPKGNKEARSHVYKLRQSRSAIDKVRRRQKAEALEVGRMIDGKAAELTKAVEEMIEVHAAPLRQVEEAAKATEALRAKFAGLESEIRPHGDLAPTEALLTLYSEIERIEIPQVGDVTEELEDAKGTAMRLLDDAIAEGEARDDEVKATLQRQAEERAELERLRAKEAERAQQEAAAARIREAEERAKAQAEEKARLAVLEAEKAQQRAQEAAERAEREKAEAEARAERAAQEAREQAERETLERQEAAARAAKAREADRAHRMQVNQAAADALAEHAGLSLEQARAAVVAIVKKQIPGVTLAY